MPSDHEVALAFVARRQASRSMTAAKWSHHLSLDLGWMNPGQARSFIDAAVRGGLLAPDGEAGHLRLLIDPQLIEVPRGFRPKADAVAPTAAAGPRAESGASAALPEPDLFLSWVTKLAAQRGTTREQVLGQVATLQESMAGLLTAEAAVLLLARRNGVDVAAAAEAAEAAMVRPSRRGAAARAPASNP
jgi:hypothetical protein